MMNTSRLKQRRVHSDQDNNVRRTSEAELGDLQKAWPFLAVSGRGFHQYNFYLDCVVACLTT